MGQATFQLRPGRPAPSSLRLLPQGQYFLLGNEFIVLRLPRLPGAVTPPVDLASMPAPLLAVGAAGSKNWLGGGAWVNADRPLRVKEATTSVIEEGPVRITVRYKLIFTADDFYQADITVGDRQDCAIFADTCNVNAPKAAFRFSFQPGLGANRVYWRNNYFADQSRGLTPEAISFDKENLLCKLRPWSFWWLRDLTAWAGFFKEGAAPFVGMLALRPSRWTPTGWDGFDRTEIPITAQARGTDRSGAGPARLDSKKGGRRFPGPSASPRVGDHRGHGCRPRDEG